MNQANLATELLPWFQILAPVVAAIAAAASWRSANAASRTAARAEETARRTAAIHGVSRRPELTATIEYWNHNDAAEFWKQSHPDNAFLRVTNRSSHPGVITSAEVRLGDGRKPKPFRTRLAGRINAHGDPKGNDLLLRLGPFPRVAEAPVQYTIEFTDDAGYVTWRQDGRLRQGDEVSADRVYSPLVEDEPVAVYGIDAKPHRRLGLGRHR